MNTRTVYCFILDYFWDVMPFSRVEVQRRFGGTYCLYLQGPRYENQVKSMKGSGKSSSFFLHAKYVFDSED